MNVSKIGCYKHKQLMPCFHLTLNPQLVPCFHCLAFISAREGRKQRFTFCNSQVFLLVSNKMGLNLVKDKDDNSSQDQTT